MHQAKLIGLSPCSFDQPPKVTISISPIENSRISTMIALVAVRMDDRVAGCEDPHCGHVAEHTSWRGCLLQFSEAGTRRPRIGEPSGRDGIGRHARFRSWWAQARGGSS